MVVSPAHLTAPTSQHTYTHTYFSAYARLPVRLRFATTVSLTGDKWEKREGRLKWVSGREDDLQLSLAAVLGWAAGPGWFGNGRLFLDAVALVPRQCAESASRAGGRTMCMCVCWLC